jgi:hypothetical protein
LSPPALGNGTGAACAGCVRRPARRSAVRARSWSDEGFDAGGRGRATGASTVTGGRFGCCASAPENEATAIRPATAETFLPELLSNFAPTELTVAIERNDLGAFALPITRPQLNFSPRILSHATNCPIALVSSVKMRVNADRLNCTVSRFESIQIKTILN